jgi:4-hydroxy-tetrahydrodipicolinate synthase
MKQANSKEVWPVMLTPFTDTGAIDYNALEALIEWYQAAGVDGLFAVCQSSEMFFLSLAERVGLAAFVKRHASIPVIASGHVSFAPDEQAEELKRMADTGIDALILLTNRFAQEGAPPESWREAFCDLLPRLDPAIPLGFYECPQPYKHLLREEELSLCISAKRFRFIKDTCCNIETIRRRTAILAGSGVGLYNANTSTLLESYRAGAAGFSGVMANFHPELYVRLSQVWESDPQQAELLQAVLSCCSQIEKQWYPVNAKYHLTQAGLPMGIYTRTKSHYQLSPLFQYEVKQMDAMVTWVKKQLGI